MIYTVECSFADLDSEAEWNDFYSLEKLPALISVTGFHTSQRFKAISDGCPVYLAIHTIDGLDVLTGDAYRRKGGGNFAKWQQHITDWHRNLYGAIGFAPAITEGERLALCAGGPDPLTRLGLEPLAMQAVALEKFPERRWLAVVPRNSALLREARPKDIHLYAPMTEQLTSARSLAAAQE
ncbi:sugar ABC transporter [Burkholderia sp. Ac-20344]|uniref:sugar ABC transporter n=1 Tax=Burkholderia sp. Ac-20344 TaxID=2703890 RepID=UPI00197CA5D0|nr:sugar ABC transporter [Burkholderia sp. Ac-20344]MBN3836441.1 sugar ABC transporter [Burkholderia sp. Ac-20344]